MNRSEWYIYIRRKSWICRRCLIHSSEKKIRQVGDDDIAYKVSKILILTRYWNILHILLGIWTTKREHLIYTLEIINKEIWTMDMFWKVWNKMCYKLFTIDNKLLARDMEMSCGRAYYWKEWCLAKGRDCLYIWSDAAALELSNGSNGWFRSFVEIRDNSCRIHIV